MKCGDEIVIDADREMVWRGFACPWKMGRWQPTPKPFTRRSGAPGEPGRIAELVFLETEMAGRS